MRFIVIEGVIGRRYWERRWYWGGGTGEEVLHGEVVLGRRYWGGGTGGGGGTREEAQGKRYWGGGTGEEVLGEEVLGEEEVLGRRHRGGGTGEVVLGRRYWGWPVGQGQRTVTTGCRRECLQCAVTKSSVSMWCSIPGCLAH